MSIAQRDWGFYGDETVWKITKLPAARALSWWTLGGGHLENRKDSSQGRCRAGAEGKLRHSAVFSKSGNRGSGGVLGAHSLLFDKHAGLGLNGVSVCCRTVVS